ncbi:hypothetical protein ALO_14897 [Acetonema longum DSM 6540]|uniref:Uncharacterized protein n=1 Tax=Acetonema longum DSM 6540 TaxID=1009370 RepID=F7NLK7_9FIRM|nr:hypothetical protein ALO_14897 [Acetonema longum DSM 6540]
MQKSLAMMYIRILEGIYEKYKGDIFNDTCISEVRFF